MIWYLIYCICVVAINANLCNRRWIWNVSWCYGILLLDLELLSPFCNQSLYKFTASEVSNYRHCIKYCQNNLNIFLKKIGLRKMFAVSYIKQDNFYVEYKDMCHSLKSYFTKKLFMLTIFFISVIYYHLIAYHLHCTANLVAHN